MKRIFVLLAGCVLAWAQPLRELAAPRHLRIGTAVNPAALSNEDYAATLAREFNQVEPENALKFGPIHPAEATYNFGPADQVAAFARTHDMALRGHTLVWHNQNPPWVNDLSPERLANVMHDHIRTVVGHYAGQVYAWDVVNEAVQDDGTARKTVWSADPEYIEHAFRWAHEADPKALLFYNDYSAEAMNGKSDAVYRMVRELRGRGVPINGVGMQMHFRKDAPPIEAIEANMKRLTDLGLEVQITELDVRLPAGDQGAAAPADLEAQAKIYGEIVAACRKFPKCTAIQTWGFTDRYSWIPRTYRGFGAALPFDAAFQPKPAYRAIAAALK